MKHFFDSLKARRRNRRARFAPHGGRPYGFEQLERRQLLATVNWTGLGDGTSWHDPNNWSGQALPGQADDVTINAPAGTTINIIHGDDGVFINSLVSNSPIFDDGSLEVATTAQMSADVTVDAQLGGGTWTFSNGAVLMPSGFFAAFIGGVTLNGNLDASNDALFTVGDLTLNGTMFLGNSSGSTFGVVDVGGFLGGSGSILFGASTLNAIRNDEADTGPSHPGTMTIEPDLLIHGQNGSITSLPEDPAHGLFYGNIVNEGTINADVAGGTITASHQLFNQGLVEATSGGTINVTSALENQSGATLSASGGTLDFALDLDNQSGATLSAGSGGIIKALGQLRNQGTLNSSGRSSGSGEQSQVSAQNLVNASGATLTVGDSILTLSGGFIQNQGTITATNSTVNLAGEFSQAGLGTFIRNGGTVNVSGKVDGDIVLDSTTGSWNFIGNVILQDAQITENDGVIAGFAANGQILQGMTINGDLNLALASSGFLYVQDSLTVTGNLRLGNASGTNSAAIFLGTGAQNFGSTSSYANTQAGLHISENTKLIVKGQIIFGPSFGNAIINNNLHVISPPGPNDPPADASYTTIGPGGEDVTTYFGGSKVEIQGPITGARGQIAVQFSRCSIQIDTSVTADGPNSAFQLGGSGILGIVQDTLINNGTLLATNGASLVLNDLSQTTGTVSVTDSALRLGGTLANHSTITATDSSVDLSGTFTQADLGVFNRPGSTVSLSGTLEGGLTLDANTGSWFMHGGTIDGGTVTESDGAELAFTQFGGRFGTSKNGVTTHVTFNGDMDLDAGLNAALQQSPYLFVIGGLTLNGTMFLGNAADSAFGSVYFGDNVNAPRSLLGNGTVVFSGTRTGANSLVNGWQGPGTQTFTIGPNITIRGRSGSLMQINGTTGNTIVLLGTVSADLAGGTIQLGSTGPVINQGTIQAINGGGISGINLINSAGKTITVTDSTLSLSGGWSNAGTIVSTNSTLNLDGTFTRATLGNFVRSGGTVNLTGTLNGGLNLDAANGSWTLLRGTINGGSINTSGGSQLILSNLGGTLAGVTVNGSIDDTHGQFGGATITGGLVLNGTITMGAGLNFGILTFGQLNAPAGSLTGNGTIVFASNVSGGNTIHNESNLAGAAGTLTIGPNITIHGKMGGLINDFASGEIVNQGKIIAEDAAGTLSIGAVNGTFSNQGTMQANGGTFRITCPFSTDGHGTLSTNWAGSISAGADISGSSTAFASSNPQGVITLNGASSPAHPQLLEAMSQDLGATAAGFKQNFVYGTIVVATPNVQLVDQLDNATGGPDALYVNSIVVGGQLDLNGIHVYARAVQIGAFASAINGTITQIPDGGAMDVNSPLPGAITPAGNQDTWTFFGRAGEAVTAYVNPGIGNAPAPIFPNLNFAGIQLVAPDNTVLASGNSAGLGAAVSLPNITLPTDGVYSIKIGDADGRTNDTGNYDVAVWDVTPQYQPLLLGQNTHGSINTPFDIQNWTFSALAGEQVRLHINNQTSSGLLYTLTGPNGFVGFTNLTGDSPLVNLTQSGAYTLSVQGLNGATGNYSFDLEPTTVTNLPLFGNINGLLEGSGQAELFTINVPTVQVLSVILDDSSDAADSNELYLRFGAPPTRETYDYRYANANSADQSILVPSAAVGTWYVLVYGDNVPVPSSFTLSARGDSQRLTGLTPTALGNSAPETIEITGAGFQPGSVVTLVGPGNTQISPTSTSVISFTQIAATFAPGVPPGVYSVKVTQGTNSDTLGNVFTVTAGGTAHLQTGLQIPDQLGRHVPATLFVTYSNAGTVAMPAPLLVLGDTNPLQKPLLTLDSSKITQGLWSNGIVPSGFSNTIQILASGQIPGVLLPGESITVPVYYAGMQLPWDFVDSTVPMNLSAIDATDTESVDWNSLKSSLQPTGVSNAAWNKIFSNLTQSLGNTWGGFVSALGANAAYLGGLGENVTDVDKLWNFMYLQANDALGPVEHLQTVFDASLPLPNGGSLSFWRNYHLPISGRFDTGILGNGWSVPYQSALVIDPDGNAELRTVGEATELFQEDTRGGFFKSDDGNSLVANGDGTYAMTAPNGESDTYSASGVLLHHDDPQGDRINFSYDGSGRLISLTASTGQSITLGYNTAGLLGTLETSAGDVIIYNYDATNHYLMSVNSVEGAIDYGYDTTTNELTSIQNADGSFTHLTYDSLGRLLSLAAPTNSLTLSYEQPGEISGKDALDHVSHAFFNESGELVKSVDAMGNPTYFTYDSSGNPSTITDALGDFFHYQYDATGKMTSVTDPLGFETQLSYTAVGALASYTDANNNETRLSYTPTGTISAVSYPDGTQEQFTLNNLGEATSIVQRNGQTINYTYDADGNITKEAFADGSHYDFTYDGLGEMLTATDSTGTTIFNYTPQGSLASVTYPDGKSLAYTYNSLGQLVQRVDQSGYTLNFAYDSAGRPWKLLDGSNQPISTYSYNAVGELTRQDNANGTFTTYGYDPDGNLLHVINHAPGGAINSEFDANYNLLNQMLTDSTPDGSWSYDYDAGGQLTRAIFTSTNPTVSNQDLAYTYDAVGNRTGTIFNGVTTNYSVNAMNEYTTIGGVAQQYDANGNLLFDGTTTYTYNPLNQLTGFTSAQGSSQFTYNALGQRVNATMNGVFTQFLNDPNEAGTLTAEYDANGQLLTHFNEGLGIASQTTAAGASFFYDADPTSSIAGMTDSTGAYANRYNYRPFGQLLSSSGSVANPFQFAGSQMVQTDSPGLFSMGLREYSTSVGRFNSTDPLQIAGGNWNLYTYAYNQPLQLVDPSGLKALDPHEGEPWTIKHGIPIIPPNTIYNAMGGASAFKTDSFPEEPPSNWESAKEAGGPFTETIKDVIQTIVFEQRLPTKDEILDHLEDHAFDALNKGPLAVFQVGTILKMLSDPQMALNIGNGILGIQRAHLCGTVNGYEAQQLVEIGEAPPGCANAPGVFGPRAPAGAGVTANSAVAGAIDPNDKIGPGFGTSGFVAAGSVLPYRIDFENDPLATAPAQQVVITDQLASNLEWSSLRITEVGWGDIVITVPPDSQFYQTSVPMTDNGETFSVEVQVGINLATGIIRAQFFSIDPTTQLPPDVLTGFLPPEDGTGRGMGHVSYTISPKTGLPTGTQIRNVADVSFDAAPIIATNQVSETDPTKGTDPAKEALVTIDAGPPMSRVAPLPAQTTTPSFTVSWSGSDDAGGSGIATFDVFVQTDGGPFVPFVTATTATSATFNGAVGHSYGFYSVATDNVGNREATPAAAEAITTIATQLTVTDTSDSGAGSLRQAILEANSSSGTPHTIVFQLPAGPQSITLLTSLPAAADLLTLSLDATQNVVIVGSSATAWSNNNSLTLSGAGNLVFVGGIDVTGNVVVNAGSNLTANHIVADALVIGGTDGSPAIVTIAASDANGNPLNVVAASSTSTAHAMAGLQTATPIAVSASEIANVSPLTSTTDSSEPPIFGAVAPSSHNSPGSALEVKSNSFDSMGLTALQSSSEAGGLSDGTLTSSNENERSSSITTTGLTSIPGGEPSLERQSATISNGMGEFLHRDAVAAAFADADVLEWAALTQASRNSAADADISLMPDEMLATIGLQWQN